MNPAHRSPGRWIVGTVYPGLSLPTEVIAALIDAEAGPWTAATHPDLGRRWEVHVTAEAR